MLLNFITNVYLINAKNKILFAYSVVFMKLATAFGDEVL